MNGRRIVILGAGAWGTALGQAAARAGNRVHMIARDPAIAADIAGNHRNTAYLGDRPLAESITADTGTTALATADIVLCAVPAQATRHALAAVEAAHRPPVPVIATAKGFERETLALQSDIVGAVWPGAKPMVLSGPSFAVDVAAGHPTAVTLAGDDDALTRKVAETLAGDTFRLYASADRRGVELAGGLKNVYALACGAVEGAGLGLSARSALIARAHAEMTRLIEAGDGSAATTVGLAGLGDLALSCTSTQSRNYRFGFELGRGRTVAEVTGAGLGLAEGVATAPVARALAERAGVDAPLIGAVNLLLEGATDIADIVRLLMTRPLKKEDE